MPYIIAVVAVIAIAAFFALRPTTDTPETTTPVTETTTSAPNEPTPTPAAPAPGTAPEGFVEPTEPPPGSSEPDTTSSSQEFDPVDDERTFSATASYLTPRRTNHDIEVTLTLKDRVVVATEVLYDGKAGASTPSHSAFDAAYEAEVIGKELNQINLSRVGGASLTSTAFNEAVAEIRSQS